MEKENIIIQYISVWSWHILSIIFLVGGFNILFSGESVGNNVMFIVFLIMWVFCEIVAFYRKRKIEYGDLLKEAEDD